MNPLRRTQWIATTVLLVTILLLGGLLGRVAWIEKHANAENLQMVVHQSTAVAPIMPNRGMIRLQGGQVIAASVRMYNLYADPAYVMDPTGKTLDRWKLQQTLNDLSPGDSQMDDLKKQIAALDAEIDDQQTDEGVAQARQTLAEALAPIMGISQEAVIGMIQDNASHRRRDVSGTVLPVDPAMDRPRRFLWLAREVDEEFYNRFQKAKADLRDRAKETFAQAKTIKDQKAREAKRAEAVMMSHALDGVGFDRTIKRVYPMGSMAAQLIGYANNTEGVDGLERQFDDLLRGKPGAMDLFKDASRRTLLVQGYKPAEDGCGLWLTLDTMIQNIAEKELSTACVKFKAPSGVAIVMDPYTGKILAMANYPMFDAADFPKTAPAIRKNSACVDPYEPGSAMKPFVMGWALEHHFITPTTMIDCHGGLWHDPTGRTVSDFPDSYGVMPVTDVLAKSSNIGMTQIGWMMGIPTMSEGIHTFGFGGLTGVELPGDSRGILKPEARWNKGTLTSVSFGYEIGVTPLQLIRAFATFTNGGYLVTPRVVDAVEVSPGKTVRWEELAGAPERRQILSAKTCDEMKEIMEQVYLKGTAHGDISGIYRLYGKTGTAHLAIKGAGHYASDEYNSTFMCGGPVTDPHLVVTVTIHKPDKGLGHFGGLVAAPSATRIMEQSLEYMRVKPDQLPGVKPGNNLTH